MKKIFKRGMSGLLAVLMAFTVLAGFGATTAFAASETAESYMISFPVTETLLRFTLRTHGVTPRKTI